MQTNTDALEALADPTRRSIFELLADRPSAVGELADLLPVSRPAVSQHLRVLKDARLVAVRQDGNRRIYRIDPSGIGDLRSYLDRFWETALLAFKQRAESPDRADARRPPATTTPRTTTPAKEPDHA